MLAFPRLLLSMYVAVDAPANAAMVGYALQYIGVAAAFHFFDATQTVAAGALRGLQDTRIPMVLAVIGYWLAGGLTAVWLGFATPLAGLGVWIGLAVGLIVVAALLLWRWHRRERLGLVPA
jgi:MATE family multidrug resistance protein